SSLYLNHLHVILPWYDALFIEQALTDYMDAYIPQDKDLPPIPTDDSGSSRSVSQDSQVSDLRSKYDPFSSAALRAGTFGETASTECQTPTFDVEANVGEVTAHVPSHDLPPVPSGEIIVPIQTPDRAPARELSVTYTPESFNALLEQQTDEVSAMLSTAGLAQSRRRRLRAATIRARRIAEDLASPEFSCEGLNVVIPAGPTDDGAAVNSEEDTDSSASDDAGPSSPVAPVSCNPLSHENPSERTINTTSPAAPNATETSEINHCLDSEEVDPTSTCSPDRDSWTSSGFLISVPDDDHFLSPLLRGELDLGGFADDCQPPINSEEGKGVATRRSSYDPVLQSFSVATADNRSMNGSAEIESRIIRRERDTSAEDEAPASSLAAPTQSPSHLRPEPTQIVIQITPESTIQTTSPAVPNAAKPSEVNASLDSEYVDLSGTCSPDRASWASSTSLISLLSDDYFFSPLLRGELELEGSANNFQPVINLEEGKAIATRRSSYDLELQSFSVARAENRSMNCSAEIGSRIIRREYDMSVEDEAPASSLAAPTQSPSHLRPEPSQIVIQLTPPSPPSTIKPSQINQFALSREMNWYTSHRRPHHGPVSYSSAQYDRPGLVGRADGVPVTISAEALSRYLSNGCQPAGSQVRTSQHLGDVPPANPTAFEVPRALVEREANRHNNPPQVQPSPTARPSRPNARAAQTFTDSGDSFGDFSPATSQISGPITASVDSAGESTNKGVTWSAAGEAEPLSDAAPIQSPVGRFSEALASPPIRRQARAFTSRITSSLREWGNAASRLLTGRRTTNVEGTATFNPSFDPWDGFVPPQGPSPDPIPDDDIELPKSNIWNIYVKLD
ncbi:hypothetical protein FRC01_003830, partial [Tulasnella sp. 417]